MIVEIAEQSGQHGKMDHRATSSVGHWGFVTELALAEGRYAVEVLDEILQPPLDTSTIGGNGPGAKFKVHQS
jgi:hypothetical protein